MGVDPRQSQRARAFLAQGKHAQAVRQIAAEDDRIGARGDGAQRAVGDFGWKAGKHGRTKGQEVIGHDGAATKIGNLRM